MHTGSGPSGHSAVGQDLSASAVEHGPVGVVPVNVQPPPTREMSLLQFLEIGQSLPIRLL